MRRLLVIAYHFPPVGGQGAPGSQRALKLCRYLPQNGWQPVVVTARTDCYESYYDMDEGLSSKLPPTTPVVRTGVFRGFRKLLRFKAHLTGSWARAPRERSTGASQSPSGASPGPARTDGSYRRFKDTVTDLFAIPDEVAGWFLPAVAAAVRAARTHGAEAILATGRPWTSLVIGLAVKRLTGLPLVLDFRDPWMTNPFRTPCSALKDRLEAALERRVVAGADLVAANTDRLRAEFADRFPGRDAATFVTVPNSFDPDDIADVDVPPRVAGAAQRFTLVHTGFLYGKRDPMPLLEAIRTLQTRGVLDGSSFRCELVGQFDLPYDLRRYLAQNELDGLVELTAQVSYRESLRKVAASDMALLLQPGTRTQVPSKLFEYVGLGKPVFAIAPRDSSTFDLVAEGGLGTAVAAEDVEGIARALAEAHGTWRSAGGLSALSQQQRARFDVRQVIRTLALQLDELVGARKET